MAKSKPVRNVDTTKSVPINAMFKHIAGYKKRKEETREAQHAAKKKADEARRALAKRKSRKTPDHSLAVAVATTIESSRSHITEEVNDSIKSSCENLKERLASSNRHFEKNLNTMKLSTEKILRPVGQNELHFKSNDGKLAGTQLLGDRMKQFENLVAQEENLLEALRQQWTGVQQGIADLALKALGPEQTTYITDQSASKCLDYDELLQKAMVKEIETERKGWAEKIENMCKASIESMRADEEEMKRLQKKLKKDVLKLIEANI